MWHEACIIHSAWNLRGAALKGVFRVKHYEKKISSEQIYDGMIVSLRRDQVELENGDTALREVIDHPGGVAVLAVDTDGNILFVSQYRYAVQEELIELPAGKLERGEDPAAAGMRELEEECGCIAGRFEPLGRLYPTCAYDTEVIHLYLAQDLRPSKQHLDEGEFLTVRKIPADEALRMVLSGELPDAKTQVGILKWHAMQQNKA